MPVIKVLTTVHCTTSQAANPMPVINVLTTVHCTTSQAANPMPVIKVYYCTTTSVHRERLQYFYVQYRQYVRQLNCF